MKNRILLLMKEAMERWDKSDIYAVSVLVYDEGDNPCVPTFTLGYNTEGYFRSQISQAYDAQEARWNYAFWLQNEELLFGLGDTRKDVEKWLLARGFSCPVDVEPFSEEAEALGVITLAFVDLLVDVVRELHASGFIAEQFGREIPVIIHELEYYDEIADQNIRANSLKVLGDDFVRFCRGE